MPAEVSIRIDARAVDRMLGSALAKLPEARRSMARRLGILVADSAKELARVDRGELRSEIKVEETREGVIVRSGAEHSIYVEKGTRPHFPPMAPIARWAVRHGLDPGAVWRSIGLKGTKAHPFMRPAATVGKKAAPRIAQEELRKWEGSLPG